METPDRLAAYLADELDPDDRRALDDELARDGRLRAELAAMRRADDALAGLSTPTPDDGFDARLDVFVDGVLAELDAVTDATASEAELATQAVPTAGAEPTRRATTDEPAPGTTGTDRSRWVLAAAAAVILLAGVGVATLQPFGGDDGPSSGAELSSLGDQDASDEVATESDDGVASAEGVLALPLQPTIVDEQRDLDDEDLDRLLSDPTVTEVAAARLDRDTGTEFGLQLQRQLGQPAGDDTDSAAGDMDDAGTERDVDRLFTRAGEPVDETLLADTERCLRTLLEAGPTAIPAYVELATVEGQPALIYGLVTIDPQDDGFTRREIWTLERSSCQVLRFAQA